MVWLKFFICVVIILFAGQKIARYGDVIAERTRLGQLWIGLIATALITSLPELFTSISAVAIVDAPDLAVGNLIGANAFNMMNLALLDILHKNGSLLNLASQTHRRTAWFSLFMVIMVAISIFISSNLHSMSIGWIGWYSPVIIVLYLIVLRQVFKLERQHTTLRSAEIPCSNKSLRKVYLCFSASAVFTIGAGMWLATIGDEIAIQTGWGQSFVGSLFLAFSTTLPELTVSFTAMRMGSVNLAVANLIGSNLFNLTILPVNDAIFLRGPILASISDGHLLTAFAIIAMTLLFIAGTTFKLHRTFRLSWWNVTTITFFLVGAYFGFITA